MFSSSPLGAKAVAALDQGIVVSRKFEVHEDKLRSLKTKMDTMPPTLATYRSSPDKCVITFTKFKAEFISISAQMDKSSTRGTGLPSELEDDVVASFTTAVGVIISHQMQEYVRAVMDFARTMVAALALESSTEKRAVALQELLADSRKMERPSALKAGVGAIGEVSQERSYVHVTRKCASFTESLCMLARFLVGSEELDFCHMHSIVQTILPCKTHIELVEAFSVESVPVEAPTIDDEVDKKLWANLIELTETSLQRFVAQNFNQVLSSDFGKAMINIHTTIMEWDGATLDDAWRRIKPEDVQVIRTVTDEQIHSAAKSLERLAQAALACKIDVVQHGSEFKLTPVQLQHLAKGAEIAVNYERFKATLTVDSLEDRTASETWGAFAETITEARTRIKANIIEANRLAMCIGLPGAEDIGRKFQSFYDHVAVLSVSYVTEALARDKTTLLKDLTAALQKVKKEDVVASASSIPPALEKLRESAKTAEAKHLYSAFTSYKSVVDSMNSITELCGFKVNQPTGHYKTAMEIVSIFSAVQAVEYIESISIGIVSNNSK